MDVDPLYDPQTMESFVRPFHPDDEGHAVLAQAFLAALHRRAWLPIIQRPAG